MPDSPLFIYWFSPAQCVGYVAFVLGMSAYMQQDDRRFKLLIGGECLAYAMHFALLGNAAAVAGAAVSMIRSVLAIHTLSRYALAGVLATTIGLGLMLTRELSDWLPLAASCLGTIALFCLQGIPMRLVFLIYSALWIANNVIVGSIGGTALEVLIAFLNISTMIKIGRKQLREEQAAPPV